MEEISHEMYLHPLLPLALSPRKIEKGEGSEMRLVEGL